MLNWHLVDVAFVILSALAIFFLLKDEGRSWRCLKKTKFVSALIWLWIAANIMGYYLTGPLGLNERREIFGFRWIFAFYTSLIIGTKLKGKKLNIGGLFLFYSLVMVATVIWQQMHPSEPMPFFERFRGLVHNPNNFALALLFPWSTSLAWISLKQNSETEQSGFLLSAFVILTILLFGTQTRTAWLAAVVNIVTVIFLTRNRKLCYYAAASAFAASAMIFTNLLGLKDRLMYSFDLSDKSSQGVRMQIWKANWHIFLDHPIFGVGLYQNVRMVSDYYQKLGMTGATLIAHAHNQFLQILATSGIIGFVAFFGVLTLACYFFYKEFVTSSDSTSKKVALSCFLCILGFVISGTLESPIIFLEPRNYLLLFSGLGAGLLLAQKQAPN